MSVPEVYTHVKGHKSVNWLPPPKGLLLSRAVALRFLAIFVPIFSIVAGAVTALFYSDYRAEQDVTATNERHHVALQQATISGDFKSVLSDLRTLAEGSALRTFLRSGSPADRRALAEDFRLFAAAKGIYDQIRFLDSIGMEIVRVNDQRGDPVIVPDADLQSKADRYYVSDALRLAPGEVFVSPFDLNVENGLIEQPPKPTIRFATPIADERGETGGIVVLNYLGTGLIDKLHRASRQAAGQIMLLNSEGYWLHGGMPDDLWAFMYPDRVQQTFVNRFPAEWKRIAEWDEGQFEDGGGMFTFATVHPVREAAAQIGPVRTSPSWKLVSHIPSASMAARASRMWTRLAQFYVILAAVLGGGAWLLAYSRVHHRGALQQAQERILQSERLAAIGEAMTGLAHESRNALQRSQACLEMLSKRLNDAPEAADLISRIQKAQDHLYQLYEEVRGYAAPINLKRQPCDLHAVFHEAWSHLAAHRDGRDIRLVENGAPAGGLCNADPFAIEQVFRNVLENAIGAESGVPGRGPLDIRVTWGEHEGPDGPAIRVSVSDSGAGLTPEQRQRIFEPFYTTKARGTGLGMAISRRIIEAHGGRIMVGDAGPGAEIIMILPRGTAA